MLKQMLYIYLTSPYPGIYRYDSYVFNGNSRALKTESCHNAKFVVTGGAGEVVIMATHGAISDDKVGIMTTFVSRCIGAGQIFSLKSRIVMTLTFLLLVAHGVVITTSCTTSDDYVGIKTAFGF